MIASIPLKHPQNISPIAQFYADCAAGTLPAVSFVDSDIGVAAVVGDATLGQVNAPFTQTVDAQNEDEEGPADISLGENFVSRVTNAVLRSPLWPRILLVWTYDEHGGYYDHVPPPAAIPPDDDPAEARRGRPAGRLRHLRRARARGRRLRPSKRHAVTSAVHDHTSILATIERKWNLPALTHRDANATTLMDFLSSDVTFPEPPRLAAPYSVVRSERTCSLR